MIVNVKNNVFLFSALVLFGCADEPKSNEDSTELLDEDSNENLDQDISDDEESSDSLSDISEYDSGVYTFAGSGDFESTDGFREQAGFAEPMYMRQGPDGSIYVIDRMTGILRTISLDGTVQSVNYQGATPRDPVGLDIADNGDIYISSSEEHCIYKISEGVSSIFAGTCSVEPNDGAAGYEDGQQAKFFFPKEIVLDQQGNLIVADASNLRLRIISPNGVTSTLAGTDRYGLIEDGPALSSIVYYPISVTVDADDNVYFAGLDNCIRRIVDGNIETIAARCQNYSNVGNNDGDALSAMFDLPRGLYFNTANELMITDANNSLIRVLSEDLTNVSTLAGIDPGYYDGSLEEAKFDYPSSILEIDNSYLVTDSTNGRIRLIIP